MTAAVSDISIQEWVDIGSNPCGDALTWARVNGITTMSKAWDKLCDASRDPRSRLKKGWLLWLVVDTCGRFPGWQLLQEPNSTRLILGMCQRLRSVCGRSLFEVMGDIPELAPAMAFVGKDAILDYVGVARLCGDVVDSLAYQAMTRDETKTFVFATLLLHIAESPLDEEDWADLLSELVDCMLCHRVSLIGSSAGGAALVEVIDTIKAMNPFRPDQQQP